ncbi:WD40/YVTN/BNR-like repeat-containing protein [Dictyobacter arantiisoli]|uniref:Photosynthesis system II assembly factor Ycf48/Hcf136-like domain-containing protein n=1 Tax=Dictyobacter arantiisoli TaxID=2014874 RepID=A0A5A5THK1_9CHLR|nr:hypothetical protein [Dictyobacter arantiisoli]GCF11061.1 hypothetical protein KDI_46250 [Dictyobacter arantiisoli]
MCMFHLVTKFHFSRSRARAHALSFSLACLFLMLLLSACGTNTGILHGNGGWQASGLNAYHFRALAVNGNTPQKVYAGSDQGAIFTSSDSGDHWTRTRSDIGHLAAINALGLDTSGKNLYAAADSGLWSSSDGGQHWQELGTGSLPTDTYLALAFDLNASNHLYVGTAQHGIYMSKDAGQSWSALTSNWPAGTQVNGLTYAVDQKQLWAATSTGVYRTQDDGKTWNTFNLGLPTNIPVNVVVPASITGGQSGLVYVGTQRGFYLSHDNGAHWVQGKDTLAVTPITSIVPDFRSSDSHTLYIGTGAGTLQSDDEGQTWRAVANGLPSGHTVYALAIGGTNNSQLFAALNDIYLNPGNNQSGSTNILPIILFIAFFVLLYYFAQGKRRRRLINTIIKREDSQSPPPPTE